MAENDEPDKVWDEYDWERFLQQQDRKTEKYMELLEKYIDDPNRDQIIAREMGWHHLLDEEGQDWADHVEQLFEDEAAGLEEIGGEDEEEEKEEGEEETHPLYAAAFSLTIWIDKLMDDLGSEGQNHPAAVKLATQSAVASAKLAAALSDDDVDEIGMTIAYLKRALRAITTAMDAAIELEEEIPELTSDTAGVLRQRLFQIRDGIIALMGEYRAEWRSRFGE